MQLAAVTVVDDEAEVQMLRELLRTNGIECWCRRTDIAAGAWTGWTCTGGPVELHVGKQDLEAARELLQDVRSEQPAT